VCAARFPLKTAATGGACVDESGVGQTFVPAFKGLRGGRFSPSVGSHRLGDLQFLGRCDPGQRCVFTRDIPQIK
jgi:hypothetical protein